MVCSPAVSNGLLRAQARRNSCGTLGVRRHRVGCALAEIFSTGSLSALLAATTLFCWSPCAVRIGLLGTRTLTTRDLAWWRYLFSGRTLKTERQRERGSQSTFQCFGGGKHPLETFYGRVRREPLAKVGCSRRRILRRGKMTSGTLPVRNSLFPRLLCSLSHSASAQPQPVPKVFASFPVRSLTSLSPKSALSVAAILASVSCLVWTFERSADGDRHTAVLAVVGGI